MKILVTGAAGFIGAAFCERFLQDGHTVVGVDNLNAYYEVSLKENRLQRLRSSSSFRFSKLNLSDLAATRTLFQEEKFEKVVHLAAQAGVRYSLENPHAYVDSNLVAFVNVLEGCRSSQIRHLIYASSSSVYGANSILPFSVKDSVDHPLSLYAATKKANELMAHSYSHLFAIPSTGLRFFTVYGPRGRPDMAPFIFTRKILQGETLAVYGHGKHLRDFTYIDDIVEGLVRVTAGAPPLGNPKWKAEDADPSTSSAPYRLYNIGHHKPTQLLRFIELLEENLKKKAVKEFLPAQPGDMISTEADVSGLEKDFDYSPQTSIEEGVSKFVTWYREYYRV